MTAAPAAARMALVTGLPAQPPAFPPPSVPPPSAAPAPRPPRGGWVQVLLALLVVAPLGTVVLLVLGVQAALASDRAQTYGAASGETDVLVARLDTVEISPLMPVAVGVYEVDVPADAPVPEAGGTAQLKIDQRWGLPPSEDHAQELQVLVRYGEWSTDDGLYAQHVFVLEHGPVGGTLEPVSQERVDDLDRAAQLRWGAVALAGVVVVALLVALVVRAARRSRRRRAWLARH
jgi:hypothetical protein